MAQNSSIIFITGGVRSGKSTFAEKTAEASWKTKRSGQLHYLASMQPSDEEMRRRIHVHQDSRLHSGFQWNTWEKPTSIGDLARQFSSHDVVLLDCLTTWLNNELFYQEDGWQDQAFISQLFEKMWSDMMEICQNVKTFIIVSNEVLNEPIHNRDLVFTYRLLLGNLHQRIVGEAEEAYLVEAGIPILMKGDVG
jgi:adenosylcobinamide kinase / adenosylcobinamide-phosphate guanylyltransferase